MRLREYFHSFKLVYNATKDKYHAIDICYNQPASSSPNSA